MAVHDVAPDTFSDPPSGFLFRLRVQLAAARLDSRLAAGEDPAHDPALGRQAPAL